MMEIQLIFQTELKLYYMICYVNLVLEGQNNNYVFEKLFLHTQI